MSTEVKVRVLEGFAGIDFASGPGERYMPLAMATKYACFVEIIEEEIEVVKPVKMAIKKPVKRTRKTTKRK